MGRGPAGGLPDGGDDLELVHVPRRISVRNGRRRRGRPTPPPDVRPKIVVLGDSLTAGLGLVPTESFPAVLQRKIDEDKLAFDVVNAGVSGDTSAGGLRRLDWSLQDGARVLVVALGANDGLRGLPVRDMKQNLATIIERAQAKGVVVILAGMEAPPNYGREYASQFRQAYRDLAMQYNVRLVPFLLDGVAGQAATEPGGRNPPECSRRAGRGRLQCGRS